LSWESICFASTPPRSKGSTLSLLFSLLSITWGICFSLKANPKRPNRSRFGTVLAQLDLRSPGVNPLVRQFYWHTGTPVQALKPDSALPPDNRSRHQSSEREASRANFPEQTSGPAFLPVCP